MSETSVEAPANLVADNIGTPKAYVPTAQQLAMGWDDIDLRTKLFVIRRQSGTARLVEGTRTIKEKVAKDGPPNEDGTPGPQVSEIVEKQVPTKEVQYSYDSTYEQVGDPYRALTGALRAQAEIATEQRKNGYKVFERLKMEYGVWFVQDPEGIKDGFRYSVSYIDRPIEPPKEKKPRAVKEPKPVELDADGNPVKKTRAAKVPKAAKETAPAVVSDVVSADDMVAEDED